jgi:phosphoglycolate phosphatase
MGRIFETRNTKPGEDQPGEKRCGEEMMQPLLIFDLDGTLIDSRLDLANSVNATRAHMGMPALTNATVYSYVGNGVGVLIRRALSDARGGAGATESELEAAQEYFLSYYREHMLDCTTLYPGTTEALAQLSAAGMKLAVLTNKPVRFSCAIVEGLGIAPYFQRVYGGNSFEQKKPHPMGVETLMAECRTDRANTVMIGDSAVDVQTARNASIQAWGVSYGFQPETLVAEPPDWLGHSMSEVAERALGQLRG